MQYDAVIACQEDCCKVPLPPPRRTRGSGAFSFQGSVANMRMPCACWKFCMAIQHFRQISGMFLDRSGQRAQFTSFLQFSSVLLPQEVEDVKRTCVAMGLCQLHCCSRLITQKSTACHCHTAAGKVNTCTSPNHCDCRFPLTLIAPKPHVLLHC